MPDRADWATLSRPGIGVGVGLPKGHPCVTQATPKGHASVTPASIPASAFVCNKTLKMAGGGITGLPSRADAMWIAHALTRNMQDTENGTGRQFSETGITSAKEERLLHHAAMPEGKIRLFGKETRVCQKDC